MLSRRIGGATRVCGIIGGPAQVAMSLSPRLHNAAFEALDLDWVYAAFPVAEGDVQSALRGLSDAGIMGLNVTIPHKVAAAKVMDRLEGEALVIGAVNTVELRSGRLIGWNTDADGFALHLSSDIGFKVENARTVVLGAGGAARAVIAALASNGADSVTILARSVDRAEELRFLAGRMHFQARPIDTPAESVGAVDLVVNATPLGQRSEIPPIDPRLLHPGAVLVDLVYHPPTTPLMDEARRRGVPSHNGIGMLVQQAALSFQIWTGLKAPIEVMSAVALSEISTTGTSGELPI